MALLEAYSSGTPVLASRLGSLDELVVEDEAGIKFEAGNADDLANKAQAIMSDPARLTRLGNNARDKFERFYSAESNYQRLMEIYTEAIDDFNLNRMKEKRA
jgi:glycosyltransferase involved in cell wall biosynthesis